MKTTVGIIDYGIGNIFSVENALRALKCDVVIATSPAELDGIHKIILPGVGSFPDGISNLNALGFSEYIRNHISSGGKILGICLGMQLLLEIGTEGIRTEGLGLIKGVVEPISVTQNCRVPHMGWNNIVSENADDIDLFNGINMESAFYFVHSFHAVLSDDVKVVYTDYCNNKLVAAYQKNNLYGVQFHPEKSQKAGIQLLKNFIALEA